MIKLQVIGNLGKDAVVKDINGKTVINFSVAHSEKYKDAQGALHERTTWVECAYWTDRTAVAPYLTKGTTVYVEGSPEADSYLKDGQAAATLRCRVFNVQLLGSRNDSNSGNGSNTNNVSNAGSTSAPAVKTTPVAADNADDDLPF